MERQMSEWKPIASVPRDGTTVLAYFPLEGLGSDWCRVVPVFWDRAHDRWIFASRAASGFSSGFFPPH